MKAKKGKKTKQAALKKKIKKSQSNRKRLVDPDNLITPQQAAELKSVSRQAIYRAISEDRLSAVVIAQRIFVERSTALTWRPKTETE